MKINTIALILAASLTGVVPKASAAKSELTIEQRKIILDGGDIDKIPVREEPGVNAEIVVQDVHSKLVTVLKSGLSFKWTELGYGAMTHKVIVPSLAAHTIFNHRNPGEDGPCLRSDRRRLGGVDFPLLSGAETEITGIKQSESESEYVDISIKIKNKYLMNREKNICKIQMVEDVRTTINGEEFYHTYTKDMGFRFIEDCPEAR